MKKTRKAIICIAFCSMMLFSLIACVSTQKVIICFHCGHENAANTKFCSNCGTKFEVVTSNTSTSSDDNTTTETEHVHVFSDATCTSPAKCECGETNGEPIEHSWSEATCTESPKCVCGATNGDPLGHDWGNASCTESAKCSRCDATNGSPLGHNWSNATCTTGRKCATCGKTDGNPLGHDWNNATCSESATCERCGTSSGDPLGHDWGSATCTEPKKCSRCQKTDGVATGHSYQSVVTPATCTEKGYTTHTCHCGHSYKDSYVNASHTIRETPYSNGFVPPTCCKEGRAGAKEYCYVCKTIIKEGDVLPKLYSNHIGAPYKINKVEQTWTQTGYSGDTCCDGCKNNIFPENKGSIIPAEKDCPWATKSYVAEKDKIKCECSRHNYVEYREPDPISIQSIEVVRTLSTPGDGVKMVGFTVTGGSFDYSADFEVISDKQYMLNRFYIEKAETTSIWDFHILLNDGYDIPDGTQLKIMITDSSGRTYEKTYTVRRHAWNNYEVV